MKFKNWRVVRDVDVFKILVQLGRTVLKKQNTNTYTANAAND